MRLCYLLSCSLVEWAAAIDRLMGAFCRGQALVQNPTWNLIIGSRSGGAAWLVRHWISRLKRIFPTVPSPSPTALRQALPRSDRPPVDCRPAGHRRSRAQPTSPPGRNLRSSLGSKVCPSRFCNCFKQALHCICS
ncbi:hypothetical protein B0T26DRAFT_201721 [Lasiosphaeria miniovina]|uniref:Secreted protein n=1 Tax=Lasiosphaeria miniovina TaxID=1954250 RepID=A0AA40E216_9PEZI|nr:uncharacterized protein B0T26DRAFT_201721 [Lasiosphaeria miniovina]KAK0722092.1 hypothetical protein B0T26DRAFT_201721 [Lasiosphaeria miniovina]